MLELKQTAPGSVRGRCFIKQDHQGAERGTAHEGVIAAALREAMALACGPDARAARVEIELLGPPAPVGAFVDIAARVDLSALTGSATASADGIQVATARGTYTRP
jgi:acyl-coenzyme A thioesterase PaaI-like protein